MKKVIITGILGYIGTELSKIYRDDPLYTVIGIDNRFLPERVAYLASCSISNSIKEICLT
jgi:nucleoside-diphosphate-sugar epimerase